MQDDAIRNIDRYVQETLSDIESSEQLTQYALNNLFIALKKLEIKTKEIKNCVANYAEILGICKLIAMGSTIEEMVIELDNIKQKYHL